MEKVEGMKFGRLTVLSKIIPLYNRPGRGQHLVCECECGKRVIRRRGKLRDGSAKSCGNPKCWVRKPKQHQMRLGFRRCDKCKQWHPDALFLRKATCGYCSVPKHLKRQLIELIAVKYGCSNPECQWVGALPACAIDFHHKNPKEKKFQLSKVDKHTTWASLIAEIEKCVTLCTTCHRMLHSGYVESSKLPTCCVESDDLAYLKIENFIDNPQHFLSMAVNSPS